MRSEKILKPDNSAMLEKAAQPFCFKICTNLLICDCQLLVCLLYDWLGVDLIQKAQLKSFMQGSGVLYVTTNGMTVMQRWCVDNWG